MENTISNRNCTGCTACSNICPQMAIALKENEQGFKYPVIDFERCVGCNLCVQNCPEQKLISRNMAQTGFMMQLKERENLKKSQSGGVFFALAKYILSISGTVYGVGMQDIQNATYMRVESLQDLEKLQGSKYVQADVSDVFSLVYEDLLNDKKVLFSGTACCIAGLYAFLEYKKINKKKLISCDIVCHGVPSPMVYKDYIDALQTRINVNRVDFRDNAFRWGWHYMGFETGHGKKYSKDYVDMFYSNLFLRPSCYECKYASLERVSDLTICDFWGIKKLPEMFDSANGISGVLVSTPKGKEIIEEIKKNMKVKKVDISEIANEDQPNLMHPSFKPNNVEEIWKLYNANGFIKVFEVVTGRNSLKESGYLKIKIRCIVEKIKIRLLLITKIKKI